MPIRFPKHHIAKSVVAQILNVADDIEASAKATAIEPSVPNVPQTATQSAVLDVALTQPISEELPGLDEAPDPGGTAGGERLLDTLLNPQT